MVLADPPRDPTLGLQPVGAPPPPGPPKLIALEVDGETRSAQGEWSVVEAAGPPERPLYRQVLYLPFAADDLAERVVFEPPRTALRFRFRALGYDALHPPDGSLLATVEEAHSGLLVTLGAPRPLQALRLGGRFDGRLSTRLRSRAVGVGVGGFTAGGDNLAVGAADSAAFFPVLTTTLALYRIDGDAVAPEATTSAFVVHNRATFGGKFQDLRFVVRRHSGAELGSGDLAGIDLESVPAAPRLGLAVPGELDAAAFFWNGEGESGRVLDAGEALAEALERHVAALGPPYPATLWVALVAESDAPCRLAVESLAVPHALQREAFALGADKEVVRFDAAGLTVATLQVRVAAQALVESAHLEVAPSLEDHRGVTRAPDGLTFDARELVSRRGVKLEASDAELWAAQPLAVETAPGEAVQVSAVALGLLPLTAESEVLLEIQNGAGALASGAAVATATATLARPGTPRWVLLPLPDEPLVGTAPAWLLLRASRGRFLWLASPQPPHLVFLRRRARTEPWRRHREPQAGRGVHHLLSRGQPHASHPPLSLTAGPVSVLPGPGPQGRLSFDLTGALAQQLASAATAASAVDLEWGLRPAAAGTATVYPPEITYRLPE